MSALHFSGIYKNTAHSTSISANQCRGLGVMCPAGWPGFVGAGAMQMFNHSRVGRFSKCHWEKGKWRHPNELPPHFWRTTSPLQGLVGV